MDNTAGVTIHSIVMKGLLTRIIGLFFASDNPSDSGIAATIERSILEGNVSNPSVRILLEESRKRRIKASLANLERLEDRIVSQLRKASKEEAIIKWRAEVSDRAYGEWATDRIADYIGLSFLQIDPSLTSLVAPQSGDVTSGFSVISMN